MRQLGQEIVLIERTRTFDLEAGNQTREIWRGSENAARSKNGACLAAGAKTELRPNADASWDVIALFPDLNDGGQAAPSEENWEIEWEPVQRPIWAAPAIDSAIKAMSLFPAIVKKEIQDAVDAGQPLPSRYTGIASAQSIYYMLARGEEAVELERPVLIRSVVYPRKYASRGRVELNPKVYTKTGLARSFAIPADIIALLPDDPSEQVTGCAWAWKRRSYRQRVLRAIGKIEESQEWVLAAWDTVLYSVIS